MGIKERFTNASLLMKIEFFILLLAQICIWIAFTTAGWGKTYASLNTNIFTGIGLWRMCSNSDPMTSCAMLDGTRNDWFGATQAFAIFGFVGINVAFLIVVLQMFSDKCKSVNDISLINAILCFVTVIIFGVRFDNTYGPSSLREFGMSFILAIVAAVLAVVAGILIIFDKKKGGGTSPS